MKIAGLVTCYNRVHSTLRCLTSLFEAARNRDIASLEIFLVDDASPDGTGEIVKERFPNVNILAGTGSLYWNRGICRAYAAAKAAGPYDAYLIFNDDIELLPDGLERMILAYAELNRKAPSVVTGPMRAPGGQETTYCAFDVDKKYRPLSFKRVLPDGTLRECDTFHGNCVLVPAKAMDDVGGLDPAYHHCFGDLDLGLALRDRGCKTYMLSDHVGCCELNIPPPPPRELTKRLRAIVSLPHPITDRIHFTYKRLTWPLATAYALFQVASSFSKAFFPRQGG